MGYYGGGGGGGGGEDTNVHTIWFEKQGPSSYSSANGMVIDLSATFSSLSYVKLMLQKIGSRSNLGIGHLQYDLDTPSAGQVTVRPFKYRYNRVTGMATPSGQPAGITVISGSGQVSSAEAAHTHDATHNHGAATSSTPTAGGAGVDTNAVGANMTTHTHSVDIPSMAVTTGAGSSHTHADNNIYQHQHTDTETSTNVLITEISNTTNLSSFTWHGLAIGQRA